MGKKMYLFELIWKIIDNVKNPKIKLAQDIEDDYKDCSHIFVPVDSTKKVLACTKCGLLKKVEAKSVDEK